jgi:two-component system, chemotaxis family, chemotaxis protein CheY
VRVLLVDDSRTMRALQRGVLGELGHTEVEEASDGQDALSKAGAFDPELVLVDQDMPTMDGLTFIRSFRRTNRTTPVIIVMAEADKGRVIEAIQAGASHYVVKPVTAQALNQRIEETLARLGGRAA